MARDSAGFTFHLQQAEAKPAYAFWQWYLAGLQRLGNASGDDLLRLRRIARQDFFAAGKQIQRFVARGIPEQSPE